MVLGVCKKASALAIQWHSKGWQLDRLVGSKAVAKAIDRGNF